uniref:AB hydrolase-1 domain-containing protein n=2 Tax=Oryza nivara TaxID=4536 RepID=A0A0E0J620_ORYNI
MPPRRRRRRSVAGIDQDDLLDPDALANPDSSFYEINGVRVHHKVCTHEDSSDQSPDSGITNADQNQIGLPIVLLHGFGSSPIPSPMTMLPAYPPSLPPRVASRLSPPRNHQSRVDLLRVPLLRAPATNDGALYCGNLLLSRCIAAAWLRSLEVTYYLTSIAAAWLRSLGITYYPARSVLHAATAAVSTPSMHAVVRFAWMSDLSLMGGVVRTGVVAFKHWALAMPSLLLVVAAQGMVLYMASNFLLLLAWPLSMMNLPAACGTAIGEDKPIEAISITGILCASPRQCTVRGNSKGLILPINSNH